MGSALFTGVTGLLTHQRRMDVIGTNIANVNTMGYRGARMLFQDLFSQTLQGGSAPSETSGGTNPRQVGLGVAVGSIDVNHTQGSPISTGVASDLAIQGNGLFVLSNGVNRYYTRDGSFGLNADGVLFDPSTGLKVLGYSADADGAIDGNIAPGDVRIPLGVDAIVKQTENAVMAGNLSASDTATTVTRTLQVYDSVGFRRDVTVTFTRRTPVTVAGTQYNAWTWSAAFNGTQVGTFPAGQTGVLLFDSNGAFYAEGSITAGNVFTNRSALPNAQEVSIPLSSFTGDTLPDAPLTFDLDFTDVTDMAAATDLTMTGQDGFPRGVLQTYSIGGNGMVSGVFSNGLTRALGQIALANFANVGGLERAGDNMFVESPASGAAQIGLPGSGGRGTVSGNALEGSNVDLGTEFSNMILTQRGYQANARTITSVDTMLQEAVNLVR